MEFNDPSKDIDGWLHPICGAAISCLLEVQNKHKLLGNFLEIGVFEGKTLAYFIRASKNPEKVIGIDPFIVNDNENKGKIIDNTKRVQKNILRIRKETKSNSEITLIKGLSDDPNVKNHLNNLQGTFRAISIDGNHEHNIVLQDLCLSSVLSSREGILILDDYCNISAPGVTSALKNFLCDSLEGKSWEILMLFTPMCSPIQASTRIFLQHKECSINYSENIKTLINRIKFKSEELDIKQYHWRQINIYNNKAVPALIPKDI